MAFDGVDEVELTSGDMVEIRKAEAQTRIIKLNQDSFPGNASKEDERKLEI